MGDFKLITPVVFIIFNRPDTAQVVFDEIRKAKPAKLLVVADGPRPDRAGEADRCALARAIIEQVDWECEVLTNYARTNLGCGKRVSSGLDWVFSLVEEAIILEDDCVPHPSFFRYCQELLEKYRYDGRIMMISGTNHLVDRYGSQYSYFFSRHYVIWGWATWKRAWNGYDVAISAWRNTIGSEQLAHLCSGWVERNQFKQMFDLVHFDKMDTWDFQWVFNCLFNNGLCITPAKNLIENIGVIGTHSSGVSDSNFLKRIGISFDLRHPQYIYADFEYDRYVLSKSKKIVMKNYIKEIIGKNVITYKLLCLVRGIYRFVKNQKNNIQN